MASIRYLPDDCQKPPSEAPLALLMVFVGHRVAHLLEKRLNRLGYNHTQAAIIGSLIRRPGLMAQDLAGVVPVEAPSITRALQALERQGLVSRQPHPTDGRASLFYLTETGREAAENMASLMRKLSNELEGSLTPQELQAFRGALGKLFARTEEMKGADL